MAQACRAASWSLGCSWHRAPEVGTRQRAGQATACLSSTCSTVVRCPHGGGSAWFDVALACTGWRPPAQASGRTASRCGLVAAAASAAPGQAACAEAASPAATAPRGAALCEGGAQGGRSPRASRLPGTAPLPRRPALQATLRCPCWSSTGSGTLHLWPPRCWAWTHDAPLERCGLERAPQGLRQEG